MRLHVFIGAMIDVDYLARTYDGLVRQHVIIANTLSSADRVQDHTLIKISRKQML